MQLKVFLLLIATAYVAHATPVKLPVAEEVVQNPYGRYIEFEDANGKMITIDLEEEPDRELLEEIERNPADNLYQLFTRRNWHSPQTLHMNNIGSVSNSNFNPSWEVIVVVHGWLSDQETDINPYIRDAFLERRDVNLIVLDWRRLATSGYVTAVSGVPNIGRGLGQFLGFLNSVTGVPFNRMHLIGFSLGAHVVGNAGRELNGRVNRITGLDPAGPLWMYNSNRLSSANGQYVEAIHTNGGYLGIGLGIGTDIGHADFHPNGGNTQPGCLTPICDHNRAWRFFASSVRHNHMVANLCANSVQMTLNTCRGQEFRMGNCDLNKFGRGTYRVNTGRSYPF